MNELEKYLNSLNDIDKQLVKNMLESIINNRESLFEMDHISFTQIINDSLEKDKIDNPNLKDSEISKQQEIRSKVIEIYAREVLKHPLNKQDKVISVSEALKQDEVEIKVKGIISAQSTPFKMIKKISISCSNSNCMYVDDEDYEFPEFDKEINNNKKCPKCNARNSLNILPEYVNVRIIELENADNTRELDKLEVYVYDKFIDELEIGENAIIKGRIQIKSDTRNRKYLTVLHSENIEYNKKQEIKITQNDIDNFHRFAGMPNTIDRLCRMFAPNVIENTDKKLGLMRSLVGGVHNENSRNRIHTLLVGPPGTAKSTLAREATKIFPNSKYVTIQNASAKSITAIIEKDNKDGKLMLRLGSIPLAKNDICVINEFGTMLDYDQQFLLDIMEEGEFFIDKYGIHRKIHSPTTLVLTSNPIYSQRNIRIGISKEEIPAIDPIIDRLDQIYTSTDAQSEDEIDRYMQLKTKIRKRRDHNYNFLSKYLQYAKSLKPYFTPQAEELLNLFYKQVRTKNIATNRFYETIFRIAEAHAKLMLKKEIDEQVANETIESLRIMLFQQNEIIDELRNPRDLVLEEFRYIIKNSFTGTEIHELCKIACEKDSIIKEYLGTIWSIDRNSKLRNIIELLEKDPNIVIIKNKPLVLKWKIESMKRIPSSDLSDLSAMSV